MFKQKYSFLLAVVCLSAASSGVGQQRSWKMQAGRISTRWAKTVNPQNVLPEYPRPHMVRSQWQNLNGLWQYAVTDTAAGVPAAFLSEILVPFPIESALSGVGRTLKPEELLWYKRTFSQPNNNKNERVILHFGAVDFRATVYVNGKELGSHSGGYQRFSFDVTSVLKAGLNELIVKVWDPSDKGPNPHGKQVLHPEGIMYTPSSGIWQTVWLEKVPVSYIEKVKITPDVDKNLITVFVDINKNSAQTMNLRNVDADSLKFSVYTGKTTISSVKVRVGESAILHLANPHLWSPDDPFLYNLSIHLTKNGKSVDEVKSYFGMRKIAIEKDDKGADRIFLNNKYIFNLGTLDQGFWPDGLYTAPTDAALQFDIEAAKAMGFNTIRKHIKIEPERWYYHADRIGMMVWQDMVNPGNDKQEGQAQFEKENKENIEQLYHHPCITTWVLFNEKWGQYDQERLTRWMKTFDKSRLVNGHSGEMLYVNDALRSPSPNAWVGADMNDVHSYPFPRNAPVTPGRARVLGEFGGIGVPVEGHIWDDLKAGWGYDGVVTPTTMRHQFSAMMDSIKILEKEGLSASIYTQPFDVESEQNGIMTYDRAVIKLPLETIKRIQARVWPATKNAVAMTKNFSAMIADTVHKDLALLLKEYNSGRRDSAFLRNLALLSLQNKDQGNASKFSKEYIALLKDPYLESNLEFIEKFTDKKSDPGFSILEKHVGNIGLEKSPRAFIVKLEMIIFDDEAKPLLTTNPDWESVETVIAKHPPLEGELIRGLSVIYYLNALTRGDENASANVITAATRYDDRYHSGDYNTWAWTLFEKTNDRKELNKALEWSIKAINQESADKSRLAASIDTHANILYKLGEVDEAVKWQEKALKESPGDFGIQQNWEKMKRGEPTWPQ